jgi:hypothetical protein
VRKDKVEEFATTMIENGNDFIISSGAFHIFRYKSENDIEPSFHGGITR